MVNTVYFAASTELWHVCHPHIVSQTQCIMKLCAIHDKSSHITTSSFIKKMPHCCACGEANSISHAICCKKGGYVSMRHNHLRDPIAHLLTSVGCRDVQTEPPLIPIDNELFDRKSVNTAAAARLDVSARGVWNSMVPHPTSAQPSKIPSKNMRMKRS